MAHLVNYEEAEEKAEREPTTKNFVKAARCAIAVAEKKSAKSAAWGWASTAAEWAEKAGIPNAYDLIRGTRYPDFGELEKRLAQV